MSEDTSRSAVTVEIAGESYSIRSAASPDHVRECAAYVDHALEQVKRQAALIESHKALILAALALTDELFQARAETDALRDTFARLADALAAEAEAALGRSEAATLDSAT